MIEFKDIKTVDRIHGLHLIVDGYVKNSNVFNPLKLHWLFDKLVENLEMKYLIEPIIKEVPLEPDKLISEQDEGGISCICMITTSHISLHAWPLRNAFMMDIFSCKNFNHKVAEQIIQEVLDIDELHTELIVRKDPKFRYYND